MADAVLMLFEAFVLPPPNCGVPGLEEVLRLRLERELRCGLAVSLMCSPSSWSSWSDVGVMSRALCWDKKAKQQTSLVNKVFFMSAKLP